jgi:hypothetical protein
VFTLAPVGVDDIPRLTRRGFNLNIEGARIDAERCRPRLGHG